MLKLKKLKTTKRHHRLFDFFEVIDNSKVQNTDQK